MNNGCSLARLKGLFVVLAIFSSNSTFAEDTWDYKFSLGYGTSAEEGSWLLDPVTLSGATTASEVHKVTKISSQIARLGYRLISKNHWYIKGHYQLGYPWRGQYKQSLYNADSSNAFQSYASSMNQGQQKDWSFAIGRQFRASDRLGITPLIGYGRKASFHKLSQGAYYPCDTADAEPQTCNTAPEALAHLNSYIQNHWSGLWYGLDMRWSPIQKWTMIAEWELQRANYNGDLKWGFKPELEQPVSQTLSATTIGRRYGLGLSYALAQPFTFITIHVREATQTASNGYSRKLLSAGGVIEQKMPLSQWRSRQWTVGINSKF